MEPGILNAFGLLLFAVGVTWCVYKKNTSRLQKDERAGLRESGVANMDPEALKALMAERYERKKLFRLGVLVCSCLAAVALAYGYNRIVSMGFLVCAGLCWYGVMRQKTEVILSQLLQQQGMQSKTSVSK